MDKLVSVVLPTYNGEKWLAQSIESVLNQTYKNLELIIVNDCSSDNTPTIIESFAKLDSRVKIIHNATNQKLPKSLNIGFDVARGDYYTWTSDDNYYELNAIEEMVSYLEQNPDKVLVYCDFNILTENEHKIKIVGDRLEDNLCGNHIGACFLYRAEIAKTLGGYSAQKFKIEDYDYFLRMGLKGGFGALHKVLYHYRLHQDSLTGKFAKEVSILRERLVQEYLPIYMEKYPQLDLDSNIGLKIRAMISVNDVSSMKKIWQESSPKQRKEIYKTLKALYTAIKNDYVIECIQQMSLWCRIRFWIHCKRYKISLS